MSCDPQLTQSRDSIGCGFMSPMMPWYQESPAPIMKMPTPLMREAM